MSDQLVSFLRNDVVIKHYSTGLLRRSFTNWKFSLSKYHIVPVTSGLLVNASFTWMRRSYSNRISDEVPANLFPFYAAIEQDGEESAYFISRLRSYMIDTMQVPPHNLPLLVHAVAMFDACQLSRCFGGWQDHYMQCKRMDTFADYHKRRGVLRRWKKRTNRIIFLKHRSGILRRINLYRVTKATFHMWLGLFQAIQYRRNVLHPRNVRQGLMQLVRNRLNVQYQRLTFRNALRFDLNKRRLWAYHTWILRLNGVSTAQLRAQSVDLLEWLLQLVHRNWLESQELRDFYMTAFGSRSRFFRCHRFIAYLAETRANGAIAVSAGDSPVAHRHAPTGNDSFSTPSAKHNAHVSFNTIPQYEPTHTNGTLHSSVLDMTLFSPTSEQRPGRRSASPLSSTLHSSANGSPYTPLRVASPSRRSPDVTAGSQRQGTAEVNRLPTVASLGKLKLNPASRIAQGLLRLSAARFCYLRSVLTALHRWMHRVPQIKLDSPHTFAIFFPAAGQQRVLQDLVVRCASMQHRPAYYFIVHKRMQHALRRWLYRIRRSRFLRTRKAHLLHTQCALRQTQAFGAWLVTTARFQQLHRTANRIVCNHFKRELWRSWFAWYHYHERCVLIRANNRELLRKRNEEIERFTSARGEKRLFQSQYSVLRDWSLVVKDRKRARLLITLWRNTVGRRLLHRAMRAWRLRLSYDTIASTIKTIWRGFRVRKIYCEAQYRYLQQFKRNIPKYRRFRQRACQKRIFAVLKLYSAMVREHQVRTMKQFHQRRFVRLLRSRMQRCRRLRRAGKIADLSHARHLQLAVVRQMLQRHRRIAYVKLLDNAHKVRGAMKMMYLWKCALQRWRKVARANAKGRRLLLRKGLKVLQGNCSTAVRIRRWRTHRLRVCAKKMLRFWHRSVASRAHSKLRTFAMYKKRRFRTWFQWWRLQAIRHSKQYRKSTADQRSVFFLKMRGGRHFQVIRGVISARVRWYMKKFIDFTSFRRRNRAVMHHLRQHWLKTKLSEAFQKLMLESHRASRYRRKLKSTIGYDAVAARRHRRREGSTDTTDALPSTGGILGALSGPRGSSTAHLHPQASASAPARRPSGGNVGSLPFPRDVPSLRPRLGSAGSIGSVGAGHSLFQRLNRKTMHANIRHVVARYTPHTRDDILARLQSNSAQTTEYSMQKRGFRRWLEFFRYNSRNNRAHARISQGFWSVTLVNAVKHLYTKLLLRRRRRNQARRIFTGLRDTALHEFVFGLYRKTKRRIRQNEGIRKMDAKWSAKSQKRFFTRIYTICFFNRYALKLKCVKRLRAAVRGALKKLRHLAWHRLRSPAALAVKKMDLKRKKFAFKRLRKFVVRGKFRRALCRVSIQQRNQVMATEILRYWREYAQLKRQLGRIARRFRLVPALKLWLACASTCLRDRTVLARLKRRMGLRVKRTIVAAWRRYARYTAATRMCGERLQRRTLRRTKYHVLACWLKSIDEKVLHDKYESVAALHAQYVLKRSMFHWHKTSLISEMCTWRSSKAAVRNWHLATRISRKLRHSHDRAETFHDAYLASTYLLLWYRRIARNALLHRRQNKAVRLRQLRKYLVYFRKWKRRMYLVYRERNFLSPLQRDARKFNMQRCLRIWHRVTRVTIRGTKLRLLQDNVRRWRSYCRKQRFCRISFLDRLAHYRKKELLQRPFLALVGNCKALRMQKMLVTFTTMTTKSRVLQFWHKLHLMRVREKKSLRMIFLALYRHNEHRCFRTWRIHTTVFAPLLRKNAVNHAWWKWKMAFAASRKYKSTLLRRVLSAWRVYFQAIDANKLLLLKRRRLMWRTVVRKLRSDHLQVLVCFRRWKTGDESIRACDFRQYKEWVDTKHTAHLTATFPLEHLYHELGASHAGLNLTMSMHMDDSHLSVHSTNHKRPAPRLLAIQRQLEKRFTSGTGGGANLFGSTQNSTFFIQGNLASVAKSPPPTGVRFGSPIGKATAPRTYASESKRTHHSPEHHPSSAHKRTYGAETQRQERYRGFVQELFSPQKTEGDERGRSGVPKQSSQREHSPIPGRIPAARGVAAARTGEGNRTAVRDRAARPNAAAPADTPAAYVSSARLWSPQGASPFSSNITPYQPPRQRGVGSLPTGDLTAIQSRGKFLHTKELM